MISVEKNGIIKRWGVHNEKTDVGVDGMANSTMRAELEDDVNISTMPM